MHEEDEVASPAAFHGRRAAERPARGAEPPKHGGAYGSSVRLNQNRTPQRLRLRAWRRRQRRVCESSTPRDCLARWPAGLWAPRRSASMCAAARSWCSSLRRSCVPTASSQLRCSWLLRGLGVPARSRQPSLRFLGAGACDVVTQFFEIGTQMLHKRFASDQASTECANVSPCLGPCRPPDTLCAALLLRRRAGCCTSSSWN